MFKLLVVNDINKFIHLCLQAEMQRFTAKIVDLMKQEKLYASQGGPIILSQVFFYHVENKILISNCNIF